MKKNRKGMHMLFALIITNILSAVFGYVWYYILNRLAETITIPILQAAGNDKDSTIMAMVMIYILISYVPALFVFWLWFALTQKRYGSSVGWLIYTDIIVVFNLTLFYSRATSELKGLSQYNNGSLIRFTEMIPSVYLMFAVLSIVLFITLAHKRYRSREIKQEDLIIRRASYQPFDDEPYFNGAQTIEFIDPVEANKPDEYQPRHARSQSEDIDRS